MKYIVYGNPSLPSGHPPLPANNTTAFANVTLRAVPLPPLPPSKYTPVPKIPPIPALHSLKPLALPTPASKDLPLIPSHKPTPVVPLVQPLSISKSPHEVMIKSISATS